MDTLEKTDFINAPDNLYCDACNTNKEDIILDWHDNNELSLCITCYVHRYGLESLKEDYYPIYKSFGGL